MSRFVDAMRAPGPARWVYLAMLCLFLFSNFVTIRQSKQLRDDVVYFHMLTAEFARLSARADEIKSACESKAKIKPCVQGQDLAPGEGCTLVIPVVPESKNHTEGKHSPIIEGNRGSVNVVD